MGLGVICIVFIEFCERICYYAFQSTQKSWLQDRGFGNAQSSAMNQIFGLLSYVSCFFGGWLADTSFGRYKTIAVLVFVYTVGCFMSAVAAHPSVNNVTLYLLGTMVLIALGTGGIKPNISTFGADQIDPSLPDAEKKKASFFMNFYLAVNVGCVVTFGFLVNVTVNGLPPLVPKEDGYFFTYVVSAGFMAVALLSYLAGTPLYRSESFLTNSNNVFGHVAARILNSRTLWLGKAALLGWCLIPVLIVMSIVQVFFDSMALTITTLVLDIISVGCLCVAHRNTSTWLGDDEISRGLDAVPVLLLGNIFFNIMYNTISSVLYSQTCQMDTRLGSGPDATQLSGAFFSLGDSFAIIIFTPLITALIPMLEKWTGRKVTLGMKVYTGIFFAMASQFTAAMFEYARLDAEVLPIPSSCAPMGDDGEHVHMSGFSSFWMAIPYTLIGIGEVLVNPVLQHYCYEKAPESMRSMLQALNVFAMGGLSNAVSAALSMATASWTPNDLNDGELQSVYFLNIGIAVVGCFIVRWAINAPKSPQSNAEKKVEQHELTPKAAVKSEEAPEVARVPSWGRV